MPADVPEAVTCRPIGVIRSPFREKFGIPRQPGLAPAARATLEPVPPFDRPEAFEGLDDFSHLWVLFHFHATARETWKPMVRPPRLGGNRRVGVFASRSMFRPNPIGLSVVALERIDRSGPRPVLHLQGVDLLDGTPVFDIKPYLPWVDAVPDARAAYAGSRPGTRLPIRYSPEARQQLMDAAVSHPAFPTLVEQVLSLDPRPAYRTSRDEPGRLYGMRLAGFDVRWKTSEAGIDVVSIEPE
ncbi:MAG TPA: tRNA (N6-threonylcarbamoyladenosine(37)-N6)-methyltransferase TrmO [Gammaproteobacteria bacterium]|nr:tRNA (N6-threonylcarbamoyladenosine(37)-N6)-methyltransferase TrmO [Gammaproteobacteria bacterium]